MKSVIKRLITCHVNKDTIKRMIQNNRIGVMAKENHHLLSVGANLILITFLIRFVARIFIGGNLYIANNEGSSWITYLTHNWIILFIYAFFYVIFSNYLLGISFRNQKEARMSSKYLKILVYILLYLIEIIISFIYFMGTLYDYYLVSLISLISLVGTLYAYFIVFIAVLDFCIYTTDNSDDVSVLKGDNIDYF